MQRLSENTQFSVSCLSSFAEKHYLCDVGNKAMFDCLSLLSQ